MEKKGKIFLDVEKKNVMVRNLFFPNEMQEIGAIGLIIRKFQKNFKKFKNVKMLNDFGKTLTARS